MNLFIMGRGWDLFAEGGLVETAQAVLLGLAILLCLIQAARRQRTCGRMPLAFLALLFATLLLREVDVQDYPLPRLLVLLGSGIGRNLWLGIGWGAFFAVLAMRWQTGRIHLRDFLGRPGPSLAFAAAGIFYAAGYPFDKEWLPISAANNLIIEEFCEFLACGFFLLTAVLLVRWRISPPAAVAALPATQPE